MKKRCSVIIIIILILIIIALVVALVVTNLKSKPVTEQQSEVTSNEENSGNDKESVNETPTYLALDSKEAVSMAKIVNPHYWERSLFYCSPLDVVTKDTLSNEEKLNVAFWYLANDNVQMIPDSYDGSVDKKYVDEGYKNVFGTTEYESVEFKAAGSEISYDSATQTFKVKRSGMGGIPRSQSITGIYKIEEYSDRYEAYAKYIMIDIDADNDAVRENVKLWDSLEAPTVLTYISGKDERIPLPILQEVVAGVQTKPFVKVSENSLSDDQMKLLSKFYDEASEYRHTFMKNADGTYYWVKSEKIK